MILCRNKMGIGGGGVRAEGGCPPRKDIGRWEDRAGWVDNSYVTISNGA